MKIPKILVGCPTSDYKSYCLNQYIKSVKSLTYQNYNILLVDNSKNTDYFNKIKNLGIHTIKDKWNESARERIVNSRNILREKALSEEYDYFFSLEQDVIPPKNVIEALLKHNKKITTGIYFNYQTNNNVTLLVPLLWSRVKDDEVRYMLPREVMQSRLIEVAACGLGCILIHRNVLGRIKFRYKKDKKSFDDIWFAYDCYKRNLRIFADTSIKCKHLIKGFSWDNIKK